MRYRELLNEKIVNRPHKLGAYVGRKIADLMAIEAELDKAAAVITAHESGEGMLTRCARYAGHDDVALDWLADMAQESYNGRGRRLERFLPVTRLRENLQSYAQYGRDFLKYVISSFDHLDAFDERLVRSIASLRDIPAGMVEYGYEPGRDYSDDEEYVAAKGLLQGLVMLADAIKRGEAVCADVKAKMGEVSKISGYGEKYRPEHDEVETLYHATAFCTEIVRDGFLAEPPEGRRGLGNYGAQNEISFTHSLEIAHTLSRVLKEVWMIAHGQLTAKHILGWIKAEKIDQENPNLATQVGLSHPGEKTPFGMNHRLKQLHELSTPEEAVKMYRVYLALSKLRSDPVMTYPEETLAMMKSRRLEDIGVLACDVRLTKEDDYRIGESEFRVMSDRVQSVRRLF